MTVSTTANTVVYRGNGSTTAFAVPFKILDQDHLLVRRRVYATGAYAHTYVGTDYSYSGIGSSSGTLTLSGTALDDDYELVIERIVPYTQDLDIVNSGGFYPETVEEQLDLMTMATQQLANIATRSISVPVGETGFGLSPASERANKYFGFDSAGDVTLYEAPVVTSVSGEAVSTRSALAAISSPTNEQLAFLTEDGYFGSFVFDSSDLSAEVAADSAQDNYIAPSSDLTGESGAWVRRVDSTLEAAIPTGPLASVTRDARLGDYTLPTSFVDVLGGSIPTKTGAGWRFKKSRIAAMDDFSGESTTVHFYVSYTAGDDADDGLSEANAVKHLYRVKDLINDSASTMFVVHLLDKVHGSDSAISVNSYRDTSGKKVKWIAEDASGKCYWIGASLAATFTWTASGSDGAYISTTTDGQKIWRSAFDANFLDHEGYPLPLTFAASHAAAQTTPGSFYRDATGTTVHLFDGREPDFQDGFILNGDTFGHQLRKDSGTDIFEGVYHYANDGTTSGGVLKVQYAANADFSSTAKVGFKNCYFGGGNGAALMIYDMDVVLEDCGGSYCSRDIFAYQTNGNFHTSPYDARLHTAYEDNVVAYEAGYQGWNGSTLGASDNCSSAHQAYNIIRVGGRYYGSDGAVIADVNGSDSANYGITAGDPDDGGTGLRPWAYWHNTSTGEGVNPRMVLIDSGAVVESTQKALVQDGSHTTAAIYVQAWQGPADASVQGTIKSYPDGVTLQA